MRLAEISSRIKGAPDVPKDIALFAFFVLALLGFFMHRTLLEMEMNAKSELKITRSEVAHGRTSHGADQTFHTAGKYVGSSGGSVYHLPNCSGAKRIKPENRIWFNSKEEAIARGYRPASNCPGL